MAKKDVDIYLRAHDQMTRELRQASGAGQTLTRTIGKLAAVAAGFVGFRAIARQTVGAINESIEFQKQLAEISTMLDGPATAIMARYKTEIKNMATEFGQGRDVLTKGLYDILSAGIAAGDGLTVLRVAAKAAIGGVTDTAVAVDALTTVMNAYGLEAEDAVKVSDLMFTTVREGKIVYRELAEQIGKIAPAAKAAGVPLEELFGMLSTMVKVEKPERAFTALRTALMTSAKEGRRFLDVVREMRDANLQEILGAGFEKRAASGVSILTANWQELEGQIIKSQNSAGAADKAFQKMADTNAQKVARMIEAWKALKSEIGDTVTGSKLFAEVIEGLTKQIRELRGPEHPPSVGRAVGLPGTMKPVSAWEAFFELGDVGKFIKERFAAPLTPERQLAMERRLLAEPGIEEAPTPLEEEYPQERRRRRLRERLGRIRRVPSGVRRGEGIEELARGVGLSEGMIAVLKLQLDEAKKQTDKLDAIERQKPFDIRGRSF
jgi:hypothetical protein